MRKQFFHFITLNRSQEGRKSLSRFSLPFFPPYTPSYAIRHACPRVMVTRVEKLLRKRLEMDYKLSLNIASFSLSAVFASQPHCSVVSSDVYYNKIFAPQTTRLNIFCMLGDGILFMYFCYFLKD